MIEDDSRNTELDIIKPEKPTIQEQNKAFFKQRKTPVKSTVKPVDVPDQERESSEKPADAKQ